MNEPAKRLRDIRADQPIGPFHVTKHDGPESAVTHWRLRDSKDRPVATCYIQENAQFLCDALNRLESMPAIWSVGFGHVASVNLDRALRWHPDGLESWSLADWAVAMAGEAGEVCNAVKKHKRIEQALQQANGPRSMQEAEEDIAMEIGDTFMYLDLLAQRLGRRLADCVRATFNRVSEREGFPERL